MSNEPLTINYKPVIGLEVHIELKTKSKMFCSCKAGYFGEKPNINTCPVCLGLPGALPVPNKTAIEWCIMIGLALNCQIPPFSKFDRKNYFYPDLPKGYQISQYDQPFAVSGGITLSDGKKIGIRRVHMEEDTGKLIHEDDSTLIDFNRSGVPLVEIVTEPDFENAKQVVEYLQKLQQMVRYLGVSDADMEKGNMRLEPNISLARSNSHIANDNNNKRNAKSELPLYKVEVKNINSFRFVEKAIDYELKRQKEILEDRKMPIQETRGWDEKKQKTVSQRVKEEASDYRYFPEPDIPPIRFAQDQIRQLADQMKELPDAKLKRFIKEYNLSDYDSKILTREKETADYFEESVKVTQEVPPKIIANWIINKKIDINTSLPAKLIQMILASKKTVRLNEGELNKIIQKVIRENQKAVNDYKNGRENAIMFLVGQVLRASKQKLDAKEIKSLLIKKIK